MPNAKVGALPQSSCTGGRMEQLKRGRGKKGITMEDLKKQTALRLAHEQRQAQDENIIGKNENSGNLYGVNPAVTSLPPSQLLFIPNRGYGNMKENNHLQTLPPEHISSHEEFYQEASQYSQKQQPEQDSSRSGSLLNQPLFQRPRQLVNSTSWMNDLRSESSSVRSYEYDGNLSSASNAEAASIVSGASSQFHVQHFSHEGAPIRSLQVAAVREDQISPLPQALLIENRVQRHVFVENSPSSNNLLAEDTQHYMNNGTASKGRILHMKPSAKENQPLLQHTYQNSRVASKSYSAEQHESFTDDVIYSPKPESTGSATSSRHLNPKHRKLPHGLTVSELKEMTRARLAAEAFEVPDQQRIYFKAQPSRDQSEVSTACYSPANFATADANIPPPLKYRASSSDELLFNRQTHVTNGRHSPLQNVFRPSSSQTPNSFNHQNYPANPNSLQKHLQSFSYPSPLKQSQNPQFHIPARNNQPSQYELLRQPCQDALETNSVASINSTLGSESIHSLVGVTQPLQEEPSLFSRSWSHPAGVSHSSTFEPNDTPKSMSSFFEVPVGLGSIGSGRRRVGTSPQGLQLEVAHENKPLDDDIAVSLFDTPTKLSNSQDLILPPLSSSCENNVKPARNMSGSIPNWVAESVLHNQDKTYDNSPHDHTPFSIRSDPGYSKRLVSSNVFRDCSLPPVDAELPMLSSTSSLISDTPLGKSLDNACNSWSDDLIGLTNHLGSLLPFVMEETNGTKTLLEEEHTVNFVSRIDPELSLSSHTAPTPDLVNSPFLEDHARPKKDRKGKPNSNSNKRRNTKSRKRRDQNTRS